MATGLPNEQLGDGPDFLHHSVTQAMEGTMVQPSDRLAFAACQLALAAKELPHAIEAQNMLQALSPEGAEKSLADAMAEESDDPLPARHVAQATLHLTQAARQLPHALGAHQMLQALGALSVDEPTQQAQQLSQQGPHAQQQLHPEQQQLLPDSLTIDDVVGLLNDAADADAAQRAQPQPAPPSSDSAFAMDGGAALLGGGNSALYPNQEELNAAIAAALLSSDGGSDVAAAAAAAAAAAEQGGEQQADVVSAFPSADLPAPPTLPAVDPTGQSQQSVGAQQQRQLVAAQLHQFQQFQQQQQQMQQMQQQQVAYSVPPLNFEPPQPQMHQQTTALAGAIASAQSQYQQQLQQLAEVNRLRDALAEQQADLSRVQPALALPSQQPLPVPTPPPAVPVLQPCTPEAILRSARGRILTPPSSFDDGSPNPQPVPGSLQALPGLSTPAKRLSQLESDRCILARLLEAHARMASLPPAEVDQPMLRSMVAQIEGVKQRLLATAASFAACGGDLVETASVMSNALRAPSATPGYQQLQQQQQFSVPPLYPQHVRMASRSPHINVPSLQ